MKLAKKVTKSQSHKVTSIIIFLLFFIFLASSSSYARAAIKNLYQVEKLFMEGKYERVANEADNLIDEGAHGREELYYLKALSLMRLGKFDEARASFKYMTERYGRGKRRLDAYIGIGDAYFLQGKYSEAVTAYNAAITDCPDDKNIPVVYYKLGCAYRKLGINQKADDNFARFKKEAPLSFESDMADKEWARPGIINTIKKPFTAAGDEVCENTGDYFYVQAGYFKSRENAQRLLRRLRRKRYDSYISTDMKSGVTYYRVKIGKFQTKGEAEAVSSKLKADGYKNKVCR